MRYKCVMRGSEGIRTKRAIYVYVSLWQARGAQWGNRTHKEALICAVTHEPHMCASYVYHTTRSYAPTLPTFMYSLWVDISRIHKVWFWFEFGGEQQQWIREEPRGHTIDAKTNAFTSECNVCKLRECMVNYFSRRLNQYADFARRHFPITLYGQYRMLFIRHSHTIVCFLLTTRRHSSRTHSHLNTAHSLNHPLHTHTPTRRAHTDATKNKIQFQNKTPLPGKFRVVHTRDATFLRLYAMHTLCSATACVVRARSYV